MQIRIGVEGDNHTVYPSVPNPLTAQCKIRGQCVWGVCVCVGVLACPFITPCGMHP